MQFKIFKIPCIGDEEAEESMNHFLRTHRIVSVTKELVTLSEGVTWCFCVEYLLTGENQGDRRSSDKKTERIDYKEVLSEADFTVFAKLRELRKEIAQNEAIPVYTVCTNEHLAQMVKNRCQTPDDLKNISGFGEAKIQKYGRHFLSALKNIQENEAAL